MGSQTASKIPYLSAQKRNAMYSLLNDVQSLMDSKRIVYWAAYDTLMGAVRHGGIIPWNDAMHLQVFDSSVATLHSLNFASRDIKVGDGIRLSRGDEYVDIVVMHKSYDFVTVASQGRQYDQEQYQFNFLFPLTRLQYGPVDIWAPQQPHEWLHRVKRLNYGNRDVIVEKGKLPRGIKLDRRTAFPLKPKRFLSSRPMPVHNDFYVSPQLD